jgi:hypothetical protein
VVIHGGGGDPAAVELDGCRRILTPDGRLRQATPQVLQPLTDP